MLSRCWCELKQDAEPVIHPPRRVPESMKGAVKKELKRMIEIDVIEKVDQPTDWVNSVVYVTSRHLITTHRSWMTFYHNYKVPVYSQYLMHDLDTGTWSWMMSRNYLRRSTRHTDDTASVVFYLGYFRHRACSIRNSTKRSKVYMVL